MAKDATIFSNISLKKEEVQEEEEEQETPEWKIVKGYEIKKNFSQDGK